MSRSTGTYRTTTIMDEKVRAFIPHSLPPKSPILKIEGEVADLHTDALAATQCLAVAGAMVPSADWFLYGFVRKEALISSQIEGTQATLEDVAAFEVTNQSSSPADAEEVCNYVDALSYARKELARPKGLPLCTRLFCEIHKRLMKGVRGENKNPGAIRTSQNWIGGTRPGNASFVPPPHDSVQGALASLERWIHKDDPLPPLVRAGLAHVQFETIHPFLDGNGRIGRLLITLLLEHWGLLKAPLLYLSLAFKRHQKEYYDHLKWVRTKGDWESWTAFFLQCVTEAANNGVATARELYTLIGNDRHRVVHHPVTTVHAIRLFDLLPHNPVITLPTATNLLQTTKPTTGKAIAALCGAGVLVEITGKRRDRVYLYRRYLAILSQDDD